MVALLRIALVTRTVAVSFGLGRRLEILVDDNIKRTVGQLLYIDRLPRLLRVAGIKRRRIEEFDVVIDLEHIHVTVIKARLEAHKTAEERHASIEQRQQAWIPSSALHEP